MMKDDGTGATTCGRRRLQCTDSGAAANTLVAFYISTRIVIRRGAISGDSHRHNEPVRECLVLFGEAIQAAALPLITCG